MRTGDHLDQVTRRAFVLRGVVGLGALVGVWPLVRARAEGVGEGEDEGQLQGTKIPMTVYMDPGCGCCAKWTTMMGAAGFETSVRNTTDMASIKRRYGIAPELASCHTALVGGLLVEGHVPADLIQKALREKQKIAGLAVPGMVAGSPGMEGGTPERYEVLAFDSKGKSTVYARR